MMSLCHVQIYLGVKHRFIFPSQVSCLYRLRENIYDRSSQRSKKQIESILSDLFTDIELLEFLFLKEILINGEVKRVPIHEADMLNVDAQDGYSVKKWIYNLFEKISKYTGTNNIINTAKILLNEFSENPLNIQIDAIYFSKDELEAAIKIYEVIAWLFGQFTLKCLFSHMIRYTKYGDTFKIDITTIPTKERLTDSLNLFDIKPSTRYMQSLYTDLERATIENYLYSIF